MEIIDQIRQVSSIVEIASNYTALKKRGNKHVGLCPFHSEKDPSFTVDEEKQLFHCFGCGVGGDVFSLVMEKESLSFPEALKYLAEKYRIPLPQQKVNPQVLRLEEKLFKINELAMEFFRKNLFNTREGADALAYLKKRRLAEETLQALKIGYALNSWNSLLSFFQAKNVPPSLLEKAGLILPGQKKAEFYDRFRGRIIFPIFSLTGKVVGFGQAAFRGSAMGGFFKRFPTAIVPGRRQKGPIVPPPRTGEPTFLAGADRQIHREKSPGKFPRRSRACGRRPY